MSILIEIPADRAAPLSWATEIVLGAMLGIPFRLSEGGASEIVLSAEGRKLVMPSLFPDLDGDRSEWVRQCPVPPLEKMSQEALPEADLEGPLPVLFGHAEVAISEREIRCGIDILGSVFFMLSRFEEVVLPDRDPHDRFPGTASLAWKAGFLYRPIVDEYVESLWVMMKRLWPDLSRTMRVGSVRVSCDVDQPFDRVGASPRALARSIAGDLGKRGNPRMAFSRALNFLAHRHGDLRFDPYYTFDWYMDVCERNGHCAAFYFIADHSAGAIDGTYDIDEPRTLTLMHRIAERGHEIGMHGSYNTFRDATQIGIERNRLLAACEKAGVDAEISGNRQHYLRWDAAQTPDLLDHTGFGYDTSGSFADRPGFRYGTAHPFKMWSWRQLRQLRLVQRPLVVMEGSVIAKIYLGLGYTPGALNLMHTLRRRALKRGGDFTLLWHNSHFLNQGDRAFFDNLLQRRGVST